ncbi:MAG: hypothetical protein WBM06_22600, partial [Pseudolabrys sp.]
PRATIPALSFVSFDRCLKTTGPARSCHFQPKFWHYSMPGLESSAPRELSATSIPKENDVPLGQKQTFCDARAMSALPPKADID